jgi:glycosyltransferase involved in cell wall biosynthesis
MPLKLDGFRKRRKSPRRYFRGRAYDQHNALLAGVRTARHTVIITMDDDLQHQPEDIPKLLEKLAEGWDVVYGTPTALSARIVKELLLPLHEGSPRFRNAFRAFRTDLRRAFHAYSSPEAGEPVPCPRGARIPNTELYLAPASRLSVQKRIALWVAFMRNPGDAAAASPIAGEADYLIVPREVRSAFWSPVRQSGSWTVYRSVRGQNHE